MTRQLRILVVLACFATACAGQAKNSSDLKEFRNVDAGVVVSLPCTPVQTRKDEYPYSAGKRYGWSFMCTSDGVLFEVSVGNHNADTPETVEKFLEYSKGDIELSLSKAIREKNEVTVSGRKGYNYLLSKDGKLGIVDILTANEQSILHIKISPVSGSKLTDEEAQLVRRIIESIKF